MPKKYNVKLLKPRERDILKYRSYQIMLYLFEVEDLKRFIIGSLKVSLSLHGIDTVKEKWKLNDYLELIVKDGFITKEEKEELVSLIDYRNDISHEIHKMVNDFGEAVRFQVPDEEGKVEENFQYGALTRIRILHQKISRGLQGKYAMQVSFDKFIFEPAERALEHESKVLFKRMLKRELEEQYKK